MEKDFAVIEGTPEPEVKTKEIKEETLSRVEEKPNDTFPMTHVCAHHLGYLSKRSSKEKIPEDCMMCENIVQCMLRAVTG